MFCYCRLLQRVLSSSKRAGIPRLQVSFLNHEHNEALSTKTNEIISEKKLPLHVNREVNDLEFAWRKQRHGNRFKNIIYQYFSRVEGSTSASVDFLRAVCQLKCHNEMINSLLCTLNNAISKSGIEFNPSLDEKMEALKSVLTRRISNYDIILKVSKIFKLNESSHEFKGIIDSLLEQQKLVEAAYCIGTLNLQHEYDIEKIFFPILVEGEIFPVKLCIQNVPNLHLSLAKKLDSLLIIKDNAPRTTKLSINSKKVIRSLNSWVKGFKIPLEQCPNLHYVTSRSAVNKLIKKRIESITDNVWEEYVMRIIGDNLSLKEHLIHKLIQKNDKETAVKMVKTLNMNDFDITKLNLTEKESHLENIADKDDIEDLSNDHFEIEDKSEHLTFNLSGSDLKYIDDVEKFTNFIQEIMNYDIVGIDTEWRAEFGLSAERLALMQIAVHDKVYILDMVHLRNCLSPEHWDCFMESIFSNENIIKLGCGIMKDIEMINKDHLGSKGKRLRITHILDMSVFYNKMKEIYPDEISDQIKEKKNLGLSKLCELILGLPLNKESRLCDWEKRPLSESQLEYAALDALCLVQIYDKLKLDASEKNMNFDHLVNLSMHWTANLNKKIRGMRFEKNTGVQEHIPIGQFKIVVDSALKSQGIELKKFGADVVILDETDSPEYAVKVSKDEDRILICTRTLLYRIEHLRPNAICFKPVNKYGEPTSISYILHRCNVQLNPKNMLSHCEVCNSEKSIKLSNEDINYLQERIKSNDFSSRSSDETVNNFQRTVEELIKSGITIKLKMEKDGSQTEKCESFLCTKCGTVK